MALLRLERGFPGERLSRQSLRRLLARPSAEVWVAQAETRGVIGDAVVLYRAGARSARLYSLIVDTSVRGRGIGGLLLERTARAAARRGCTRLTLEVRADNEDAIAFYLARGFRRARMRAAYYEDGQAALCMVRRLEPRRWSLAA